MPPTVSVTSHAPRLSLLSHESVSHLLAPVPAIAFPPNSAPRSNEGFRIQSQGLKTNEGLQFPALSGQHALKRKSACDHPSDPDAPCRGETKRARSARDVSSKNIDWPGHAGSESRGYVPACYYQDGAMFLVLGTGQGRGWRGRERREPRGDGKGTEGDPGQKRHHSRPKKTIPLRRGFQAIKNTIQVIQAKNNTIPECRLSFLGCPGFRASHDSRGN